MIKSKKKKLPKIPEVIHVKLIRTKERNYIAELVDYDVFTQAKSIEELPFYINDLIYTLFDIPKELQSDVWYQPKKESKITSVDKISLPYQILVSKKFDQLLHA